MQIDILRPGTYKALENHLRVTTEKHGEGYYHVIHFDVHGAVLTYEQYQLLLQAKQAAHPGNPYQFSTYARNAIQTYEGVKAFLLFEPDATEEDTGLVEATQLAALLVKHHVPITILNACQSGKQIGERETSLGSHLVQSGVQLVLAMGYSVTVSAAELLMTTLYQRLFAGDDLTVAIRHARTELANHKERQAYSNQEIELEDWLLPVVYQNQAVTLHPREFTPDERKDWFERKAEEQRYTPPDPTYGFVGRDLDILRIEKRLLTQRNIVLVRGMGGAGKTTLLAHLAAWWHTTGFVRRVFSFGYDEKAWTLQQIMTEIAQTLYGPRYYTDFQSLSPAAQQAMLVQRLRSENHLLLLDNLESITGAHLAIQHTLPQAEQKALRSFLADLAKGRTLVLLGSRGGEEWLAKGTFDDNVYDLPGLDRQAASTLADRILLKNNPEKYQQYRQHSGLKQILKLLNGFPLALEVVLANLAHQIPTEVLKALQEGDVRLDIDEGQQQNKDIFEQKTESILRCIDYSHSNLSPEAQQLLLCLAPFTSVFWMDQEVLNSYLDELRKQPILATLSFDHLPEVLREAQNWGLLSPDPDVQNFLRLQPIFPYFLRNRLSAPEQAEVRSAIETAFREHYDRVGAALFNLFQSKDAQEQRIGQLLTSLEYENLMSALNLALAAQDPFYNLFLALSQYIDAIKDERRGLELGQTVLKRLDAYAPGKLTGPLGIELVGVIDSIATRQLNLKQYQAAEVSFQKALKILLENEQYDANDTLLRMNSAEIYHRLGRVAQERRQWSLAEQYYQQALQVFIEFNDRYKQADIYHNLGVVAQLQQQWLQAKQYYQQALQIEIEINDRYRLAGTYHVLGMVAQAQGQWLQSEHYYQQSLQIKIEFNDRYNQALTYGQLGNVALQQQRWSQTEQYYQQALQIFIEFNDRYSQASTYHNLGWLAREQKQWSQAKQYYLTAFGIYSDYHDTYASAIVLRNLARLWQSSGDAGLPAAIAPILGVTVEETEVGLRKMLEDE